MRSPLTIQTTLVLLLGVAIAAIHLGNAACAQHECDNFDGPRCDTTTSYSTCTRGEDGHTTLFHHDCPTGKVCAPRGPTSSPCDGKPVASACGTDDDCASNLRCITGSCSAPNAAEVAMCEQGPMAVVPDHGAVELTVRLNADPALFNAMVRPICDPLDGGVSRFVRVGFFQLQLEKAPITTLQIDLPDSGERALLQTIGDVGCNDLYARAPVLSAACGSPSTSGPLYITPHVDGLPLNLVVVLGRGAATSATLRLTRE